MEKKKIKTKKETDNIFKDIPKEMRPYVVLFIGAMLVLKSYQVIKKIER